MIWKREERRVLLLQTLYWNSRILLGFQSQRSLSNSVWLGRTKIVDSNHLFMFLPSLESAREKFGE
jgi:hypothetical protein